jgi:hypothetical protein
VKKIKKLLRFKHMFYLFIVHYPKNYIYPLCGSRSNSVATVSITCCHRPMSRKTRVGGAKKKSAVQSTDHRKVQVQIFNTHRSFSSEAEC